MPHPPATLASLSILDALESGAIIINAAGEIRYWNDWIAQRSAVPAAQALGRRLEAVFASLANSRLTDAVAEALQAGVSSVLSEALRGAVFPLRCVDGRPLLHNVLVSRIDVDGSPHCLIQIHDVTARREAEAALRQSEERVRTQLLEVETLYRTAPIGLGLFDRDMRFLRVNDALAEMNGASVQEHIGRTAWELVPTLRDIAGPLFLRVFEAGEPIRGVELRGTTPRAPGIERTWIEDFYPLKDPGGSVIAVGVIVREVTEQKRLEERERLFTSELHHRIKNLFAMVEALAQQTARKAATVPEFMQQFAERLRPLAAAQDLLVRGRHLQPVTLAELVRVALAPFMTGAGRLVLDVEPHPIAPDLASHLALGLHELATNATKYGALSDQGGHVQLTGRVGAREAGQELCLEWRESDGPPVTRPQRQGFGTRLLERVIAVQHGGSLDMDWRESGLVCRIRLPYAAAD